MKKNNKGKALAKFIEIDLLIAIAVLIVLAIIGSFSYAASRNMILSPTSSTIGGSSSDQI